MYKYTTTMEAAAPSVFVVWLWAWITVIKTCVSDSKQGFRSLLFSCCAYH